jgi:fibronectin type 3 domain-containing protein
MATRTQIVRPFSGQLEPLEPRKLLAGFSALVDFQPAGVQTYRGYVADTGAAFGNRGNGLSYGWNATNNNGVDRNSKKSPNQAYDTFIHMQKNGSFTWELAVPNGTYDVKIFAGDAVFDSSDFYHILAEGQKAMMQPPFTPFQHWVGSNQPINVTDGRLTISNGASAVNNKIAFIEVRKAVPTIPTNLTAVAVSSSQIQLNWVDRAINEDSYIVERSTNGTSFTAIATLGANATSFLDSGLAPSTRYTYQIRAKNDVGSSMASFVASATTAGISALAPAAPSDLTASVTGNTAKLTWTDNSNNEDKFVIQRIFATSSFQDYLEVPANTTSANVYLLTGNTNQYRVVAKNSAGGVSDPSNPLTIFTKPEAPVYVNAQAASSTAIDVVWDSLDACVFHVERLDNGVWTRIASDLGALSFRDTGLAPGTSHSYRVIAAAVNSAGESDPSDVVTATTAPAAVTGLQVTGKTSSSVSLKWNDVSGEGFYSVERSLDGVNWTLVTYLYADTTSHTVTGLAANTTYQFRVTGMAYGYVPGDRGEVVTVTTS